VLVPCPTRWPIHGAVRLQANLDVTWLRDDSETDAADLPEPDVFIAEIVEMLTAAAAELVAAAGGEDLGAPG